MDLDLRTGVGQAASELWSQGRPGLIVLEQDELVAIPVVVTARRELRMIPCEWQRQTSSRKTRYRC